MNVKHTSDISALIICEECTKIASASTIPRPVLFQREFRHGLFVRHSYTSLSFVGSPREGIFSLGSGRGGRSWDAGEGEWVGGEGVGTACWSDHK